MKKEVRIAHLDNARRPDKGETGIGADKTQPLQTEAGSAYFERWIPVSWRGASALRSVASLLHPVT